jgi:hypothetical protein
MTQATASSVAGESPREACAPGNRLIPGSRRFWLVLVAVAVVAGAAFNWSWLVAVGVAPLLLTLLPCAAMCALHLCASKGADGSCTGERQEASRSWARPRSASRNAAIKIRER